MKCVFVGVFTPRSTNYSQAQCLENQGCEVIRFPYREVRKEIGKREAEEELGKLIALEKPQFVLFSKCNEIKIHIVKKFKDRTKMLLWYMDPVNKSWNVHLIAKIWHCHATACALWRPYKKAKKYSRNVYFVHEGFDPEVDKPFTVRKKYDVSFIGNLDKKRRKYQEAINLKLFQNVFREEHAKAVSESYINLNFVRNNSGCSDRVYKVLAAKGFLLTEPWPHLEDDFTIGKDLDIFSSEKELKEKISYYLSHEDVREKITVNGWHTVQKFNRNNWAKNILNIYTTVK